MQNNTYLESCRRIILTIGVPLMQYCGETKMTKLNWGIFFHKLSKIKIQVNAQSVIYVQLICKTLPILKTEGGVICTNGIPFRQPPARPPTIFISIAESFLLKTQFKIDWRMEKVSWQIHPVHINQTILKSEDTHYHCQIEQVENTSTFV